MACGAEEGSDSVRHEGNAKSAHFGQKERQLCPQRKTHPHNDSALVRPFLTRPSFIVNMAYCFQDKETLFLVMDLMAGGDLRYHISRKRRFSEAETRKAV